MSGNATMLIWLGKSLLGQTDRADVTSLGRSVGEPGRVVMYIPDNGRGPGARAAAMASPRGEGRAHAQELRTASHAADRSAERLAVSRPGPGRMSRRDRRPGRGERATFAAIMLHAAGIPVTYGITDDFVQFYIVAHADLLAAYRAAGPLPRLELRLNAKALNIALPRWRGA